MCTTRFTTRPRRRAAVLTLFTLLAAASASRAGDDALFIDWTRDPAQRCALDFNAAPGAAKPALPDNRIRLFRIAPGFVADPLGIVDDDPATPSDPTAAHPANERGLDWVQVWMGNDNPFFDLRRPGDPGGVGYYRVQSQVQLLESATTGLAVGLQAVTPAGREYNGVEDGPTVFSPNVSVFHTLDDGTAIQGFVGKHVNVNSPRFGNELGHAVQCGMAVQRPLLGPSEGTAGNVFVFVEALGRYRYDGAAGLGANPLSAWEMVPGLHWKMASNWWMSGGVVVPLDNRPSGNHWQFTCSIQF
jgi:hypothetical protein